MADLKFEMNVWANTPSIGSKCADVLKPRRMREFGDHYAYVVNANDHSCLIVSNLGGSLKAHAIVTLAAVYTRNLGYSISIIQYVNKGLAERKGRKIVT